MDALTMGIEGMIEGMRGAMSGAADQLLALVPVVSSQHMLELVPYMLQILLPYMLLAGARVHIENPAL